MLGVASGRLRRIAVHTGVVAAVVAASLTYAAVDKTVTLSVDGQERVVHSTSATVAALLADHGVQVGPRDEVSPAPGARFNDGDVVQVSYARPLDITVDGRQRTYWTTERSVAAALSALGLRAEGAALSASRSAAIARQGLTMWVSTPKRVQLRVDGKRHTVVTTSPTVSALLQERRVRLNPLDRLSRVPSAALREGDVVRVTRIVRSRVTRTEVVPHPVTKRASKELYRGQTKVLKAGRDGRRTAVYDVLRTDGKVTDRDLISAVVQLAPVVEIVQVGTKVRPEPPAGSAGGSVGGDVASLNWAALAACESGGRASAVNPAGYYGLYQFSLPTWRSVGGSGKPTDHSAAEQTYRAQLLYQRTGASSWPHCGPRLFS